MERKKWTDIIKEKYTRLKRYPTNQKKNALRDRYKSPDDKKQTRGTVGREVASGSIGEMDKEIIHGMDQSICWGAKEDNPGVVCHLSQVFSPGLDGVHGPRSGSGDGKLTILGAGDIDKADLTPRSVSPYLQKPQLRIFECYDIQYSVIFVVVIVDGNDEDCERWRCSSG
ncbi:hypothetical protein ElyMa_004630800 [Elysia marginata]|uniref:Uncharacterized protein n=1 Tax=Elysia marginata TaxID=1093978 RepID=A0AAV4I1F4_9GAST|nr:hypothetical protein ElyMa_004630800 [Elysia marginata]